MNEKPWQFGLRFLFGATFIAGLVALIGTRYPMPAVVAAYVIGWLWLLTQIAWDGRRRLGVYLLFAYLMGVAAVHTALVYYHVL